MAGQAQELLDATFHRVVDAIAAAAAAAPASSVAADAASSRPTLTPYLTIADQVEVGFAAMLADLCNMAYEVDKIDTEALYERHRLSLVATSVSFCPIGPAAAVVGGGASPGVSGADAEIAAAVAAVSKASAAAAASSRSSPAAHPLQQHEQQAPSAVNATIISSGHLEEVAPTMVSFSRGGPGAHASGVSVLQLTSPEAVTAALASQGHGSAFANPVYVSTLHHALVSMGSYDEEGDISDLEWRAAMAAAGPQQPRGGSLGTVGTMDEMILGGQAAAQQQDVAAAGAPAMVGQEVTPALLGDALAASPAAARSASTFFSDANLNEERDFLSGQVYGYQTPLVERRRSSAGGAAVAGSSGMVSGDASKEPVSAVTQSGAAGGRALRQEQAQRPRRSMSGGYLPSMEEVDIGASAGTVGLGQGQAGDVAAGPPVVVACAKAPPSAWFAADDNLTKTRYFAIQGSTSMEHWQINLQFEPQVFEDGRYGEAAWGVGLGDSRGFDKIRCERVRCLISVLGHLLPLLASKTCTCAPCPARRPRAPGRVRGGEGAVRRPAAAGAAAHRVVAARHRVLHRYGMHMRLRVAL